MQTISEVREHREQWAKALESGEYKQGRRRLRRGDSYCCLGVGAKLAGCDETVLGDGYFEYDGRRLDAPDHLMAWVGLNGPCGHYKDSSLVRENDRGVPFPQIAAIIRSNPPGLFLTDEEMIKRGIAVADPQP